MNSAFHPAAKEEFLNAVGNYNEVESGLGSDFASEVLEAVGLIELLPNAWPELDGGIRRCLVRRFPYALLYAIEEVGVIIYAVMHTRQEPNYWRSRLD